MKKIFYYAGALLTLASAFVSCSKEASVPEETSEMRTITVISERPQLESTTKTEWNSTDQRINWSAGDMIRMAYTSTVEGIAVFENNTGTSTASNSGKFYASDKNDISEACSTAQFTVSTNFTGHDDTRAPYVFYTAYPSQSISSATKISATETVTADIPVTQTPTATSFDHLGDIMFGQSAEYATFPTQISVTWQRLVAHADITLSNLPIAEGETINSITLISGDTEYLAGSSHVSLKAPTLSLDSNPTNTLSINATNLAIDNNSIEFWACIAPATVSTLTVAFTTSTGNTYSRTITPTSPITFKQNARNALTIDMSTAIKIGGDEPDPEIPEGEVVSVNDSAPAVSASSPTVMDEYISYEYTQKKSGTNPFNYSNPLRVYVNDDLTISASGAKITKVECTCNSSNYANIDTATITVDNGATASVTKNGTLSTITISGSTTKVVITPNTQCRINALSVYYIIDK